MYQAITLGNKLNKLFILYLNSNVSLRPEAKHFGLALLYGWVRVGTNYEYSIAQCLREPRELPGKEIHLEPPGTWNRKLQKKSYHIVKYYTLIFTKLSTNSNQTYFGHDMLIRVQDATSSPAVCLLTHPPELKSSTSPKCVYMYTLLTVKNTDACYIVTHDIGRKSIPTHVEHGYTRHVLISHTL